MKGVCCVPRQRVVVLCDSTWLTYLIRLVPELNTLCNFVQRERIYFRDAHCSPLCDHETTQNMLRIQYLRNACHT